MTCASLIKKTLTQATVVIAVTLGASAVLTGCTSGSPGVPPAASTVTPPAAEERNMLADHGLAELDARQVIEKLDAMPLAERPKDLMASIRPDRLIISDDQRGEISLPMPTDQFYVSFAPYIDQTHDCHFHSLTTCTGELRNADVQVKVTDDVTGEVLVDDELRTFDNGFLGLWLPRDINAILTVEYQDRTATSPVTTKGDEAATCVTTLPLKL